MPVAGLETIYMTTENWADTNNVTKDAHSCEPFMQCILILCHIQDSTNFCRITKCWKSNDNRQDKTKNKNFIPESKAVSSLIKTTICHVTEKHRKAADKEPEMCNYVGSWCCHLYTTKVCALYIHSVQLLCIIFNALPFRIKMVRLSHRMAL